MGARLAAIQARMAEEGIDLLALAPGAHMEWTIGFSPHADERPCLLCITPQTAAFLMPALNGAEMRGHTDLPFVEWADATGPEAAFAQLRADLGATSPGIIALDETMRADHAALVQDASPNAKRIFSGSTLGALRLCKTSAEIEILVRNAQLNDRAMEAGRAALRPGVTEREVARVIRNAMASEGKRAMFTIIGAGGNGAFPHHATGDTVLEHGMAVVMDIGGGKDGMVSDMTRMAVIGTPPEGYAEVHAVVEAAVQAALAAAKPGALARDVDQAARQVITDAGYGEFFTHRTGHGMGVEVHEPPYITETSDTVLREGMVFSIEPGIYLPGRFGIRLEDIVVIEAHGPRILSSLPRDVHVAA